MPCGTLMKTGWTARPIQDRFTPTGKGTISLRRKASLPAPLGVVSAAPPAVKSSEKTFPVPVKYDKYVSIPPFHVFLPQAHLACEGYAARMNTTAFSSYFSAQGRAQLMQSIHLALDEDGPDLTTDGVFAPDVSMKASIVAKEQTLVVGLPLIPLVFEALGEHCQWVSVVREGADVPAMTEVARIHASARATLRAERIILNFISRLSGVANVTRQYVSALEGTGVRLLDTRKTTPCLRWAEKYAVRMGGGMNHRRDLQEMLMLKDNHIDAAGSITAAVEKLRAAYGAACPPIEVECRTLAHVREAVACRPARIMMDNMDTATLAEALPLVPAGIETEISGNVRLDTIRELALSGSRRADFISVGRLTHSAPAADFSMRLTTLPG